MPLWDKVKQELDNAGRVAQDAIDEGRIRLEITRTRKLADKAAQALGYAVYRARAGGGAASEADLARYSATLDEHEAEHRRLESQLAEIEARWRSTAGHTAGARTEPPTPSASPNAPSSTTNTAPPPGADAAPPPPPASETPTIDAWRPSGGPASEDETIR